MAGGLLHAQNYQVISVPFSWTNLSSPTVVPLSDDAVSGGIALPFPFTFFGNTYNTVYISSNGFITFLAGQPNGCCSGQPLPSGFAPNGLVAGYWEDLNPSQGGTISYQVLGSAPSRIFVVEFQQVPHFFNTEPVSFQILLYESGGIIDIYCKTCTASSGNHTQGIENATGTDAYTYPGRNATLFSITNDGVRFIPAGTPPSQTTDLTVSQILLSGCTGQDTVSVCLQMLPLDTLVPGDTVILHIQISGPLSTSATDTLTGVQLLPGASQCFPILAGINFSTPGTYQLLAYFEASFNQIRVDNDTARMTVVVPPLISNYPHSVDFSGYSGVNLSTVFPGWREARGTPEELSYVEGLWTAGPWLGTGGANGTSAQVSLGSSFYSGEWILSPRFQIFSSKIFVSHEIAMEQSGSNSTPASFDPDDVLMLLASKNCGITWDTLYSYSPGSPPSAQGQRDTFFLASYTGKNVMLGWYASAGNNNNPDNPDVFLDNIRLEVGVLDLSPAQLLSPIPGNPYCPGGGAVGVAVRIRNLGTVPGVDTFTIRIEIEDGTTFVRSIPLFLNPGRSDTIFMGTWNIPAVWNSDSIRFTIFLDFHPLEDNPFNDTLVEYIRLQVPSVGLAGPDSLATLQFGTFEAVLGPDSFLISSLQWEFEGTAFVPDSTGSQTQAMWDQPGTYTVTLIACYCDRCDTFTHTVVVYSPAPPGDTTTGLIAQASKSSSVVELVWRKQEGLLQVWSSQPIQTVHMYDVDGRILWRWTPRTSSSGIFRVSSGRWIYEWQIPSSVTERDEIHIFVIVLEDGTQITQRWK